MVLCRHLCRHLKVSGEVFFSAVGCYIRGPQTQINWMVVMESFPLVPAYRERFSHSTNLGASSFYSCVLMNNYTWNTSRVNVQSGFGHFSLCCFYKGRWYRILHVSTQLLWEWSLPRSHPRPTDPRCQVVTLRSGITTFEAVTPVTTNCFLLSKLVLCLSIRIFFFEGMSL